jgi:hypothetical protein
VLSATLRSSEALSPSTMSTSSTMVDRDAGPVKQNSAKSSESRPTAEGESGGDSGSFGYSCRGAAPRLPTKWTRGRRSRRRQAKRGGTSPPPARWGCGQPLRVPGFSQLVLAFAQKLGHLRPWERQAQGEAWQRPGRPPQALTLVLPQWGREGKGSHLGGLQGANDEAVDEGALRRQSDAGVGVAG